MCVLDGTIFSLELYNGNVQITMEFFHSKLDTIIFSKELEKFAVAEFIKSVIFNLLQNVFIVNSTPLVQFRDKKM